MSTPTDAEYLDLASRRIVAGALAVALADPRSPLAKRSILPGDELLLEAWNLLVAQWPALEPARLGVGERLPAEVSFAPVVQWLRLDAGRREHACQRVFGLVISRQCPPYETEYLPWKDATHRAHKLADVAGFYNAFGLEPNAESPERPDHVALELEFVAFLLEKHLTICHGRAPAVSENALTCRNALAAFLSDHAAWWMPTFGRCLERRVELVTNGMLNAAGRADIALLGGLARVLCAWVAAERSLFEIAPVCRLIGPEVPLPDAGDNACGTCARVAEVKN